MKVSKHMEVIGLLSFSFGIGVVYYSLYARKQDLHMWLTENESEKNNSVDKVGLHDKWIVVTSVSEPSKDVEKLAAIGGWQLLVVGDRKTPADWKYPGAVFLSVKNQRILPYQTSANIPFNSYTRKNIGYLYAIEHGAKFIYDTDDDNHPSSGRIDFQLSSSMTGLVYRDTRHSVMNPYAHFGQPSIWPRGYPLESINTPTNNTYTLCTLRTPAIQQGLVNKDPDVDAVFRLTRKKEPGAEFNITFDRRAPPFVLPAGVFAPFNSQNTLFSYEALWALLLPTSVTFRVTDIWRGYWAQRLLWLLGHRLAFYPPNAVQVRNPHDYLKDFREEREVYTDSGRLIAFLKQWNCSQNLSFFECATQLTGDMVHAKFWKKDEIKLMASWLADLKRIGYQEPIMTADNGSCDVTIGTEDLSRTVYFSPVFQDQSMQADRTYRRHQGMIEFCGDFLNKTQGSPKSKLNLTEVKENILLVVVFNKPFHRVISLLDQLYREQHPNMVYCGEAVSYEDIVNSDPMNSRRWPGSRRQKRISFISIESHSGYFGYECTIRAIEMNYAVDGYLAVGDDVLFNFWNLDGQVNLSRAAFVAGSYHQSRYRRTNETGWTWWSTPMGFNGTNRVLDELVKLENSSSSLINEYLANRGRKSLRNTVTIDLADIYYVPASTRHIFAKVANVFYKHRVFLEIAVPTVIDGLHSTDTQCLSGKSIWGGDRDRWHDFFDDRQMYLHPVKLSQILANDGAKRVYCQLYVQRFVTVSDSP